MLIANNSLSSLSIACNSLGEVCTCTHSPGYPFPIGITILPPLQGSGQAIQEGMQENAVLASFDLRLTDISQQSEYCINQFVKANQDRLKANSKLVSNSAMPNR